MKSSLMICHELFQSTIREQIGVKADIRPAPLAAYRCNVMADEVDKLGLQDFSARHGIDYWGGFPEGVRSQYYKVVLTGCRAGTILSFYIFMPVSWCDITHDDYLIYVISAR